MPLVKPHDIFKKAYVEGWALGAFNTSNLEVTQAIAWALKEKKSPGIIQTSEGAIEYAGLETIRDIIRDTANSVGVPVIIHLDHGKSFEIAEKCILAGYDSVMIDASSLPFAENVEVTKKVVELAHTHNVWVEGEIGAIQGKEGMLASDIKLEDSLLTDPDQAAEFVKLTGVDALAISVGTLHGAFRGEEKIRFERLKQIKSKVFIPLVLHGASGLPESDLSEAVKYGVSKVNIDTELREAFHDTIIENEGKQISAKSVDPRKMLAPGREAVKQVVIQKIDLLGSAGKG